MEPLALLQDRIPDFPGYATEDDRRLADEDVRSYLGEALAGLIERLAPDAALTELAGDLEIRTGFTNQRVFRHYEESARGATDFAALIAADAAVVELAQRAVAVENGGLKAYLGEAAAALDRRDDVMRSFGAAAAGS